jgi:hypothetical protein
MLFYSLIQPSPEKQSWLRCILPHYPGNCPSGKDFTLENKDALSAILYHVSFRKKPSKTTSAREEYRDDGKIPAEI